MLCQVRHMSVFGPVIVPHVPHGSSCSSWVLMFLMGPLLLLIGYADDSTLMALVPSPCVRVRVAESMIRYLGRFSEWRDQR